MIVFIVVPKNSGLKKCRELVEEKYKEAKIIEVRGEDVPFWIDSLAKREKQNQKQLTNIIGITGEDLFREYIITNRDSNVLIKERIEWKDEKAMFGKPTLCLLGPINSRAKVFENKKLKVLISSKYKAISNEFLEPFRKKGYQFDCSYVSGCVETGCVEGIADLIIDIVYSGSSIEKYELEIYDRILGSDIVLLENRMTFAEANLK